MQIEHGTKRLELPGELRSKLLGFQKRVWSIKTAEAVFAGAVTLTIAFLLLFLGDRLGDTPKWLRLLLFLAGISGVAFFLPIKIYRWVWCHRRFTDLARLLARQRPRVGDRLLGIIELAQHKDENASTALCQAAIEQVARVTRDMDFRQSVPQPRHKTWGWAATMCSLLALAALWVHGAGLNALQRWSLPLADIPRYTFTQLADVPDHVVVPIGEPFTISLPLAESTRWRPARGSARYAGQPRIRTGLADEQYVFEIPAQTAAARLKISVGDARHHIAITPKPRPELTSLMADIELPAYLGYPRQEKDVRGGAVSIVKGSSARFAAKTSRELASATINGAAGGVKLRGDTILSSSVSVDEVDKQEFRWTDVDNLSAKTPFQLRIRSVADRAPTIQCSNLAAESVVLDEDVVSFEVAANDDYGLKQIGIEWSGVEDPRRNPTPDQGEYLLSGGDQRTPSLAVQGTFGAQTLGIEPQPIELRAFTEDYLPGRERVYSPVFRLYVLNREQHMIWITEKLHDWERQALEVRDQEQRLFETNQEIQQLSAAELDKESTRRRIARQAAAERANARRLGNLTMSGEQLINEAARNNEFNVASLEKWAQMLKVLKQLSAKNMPSVANLLADAANAAASSPPKPPAAPQIIDVERGAPQDPTAKTDDQDDSGQDADSSSGEQPLGLPETILAGSQPPSSGGQCPAGEKVDAAVAEQAELLAEFNRVMGELAKLLQDLQGSTFVKRLKAAARSEISLAATLHDRLQPSFGAEPQSLSADDHTLLRQLYLKQLDTASDVRLIQEDLAAYFERSQQQKFKQVHDEMKTTKVVSNFKQMSSAVTRNLSGETIAQAEYWSDQLDRWAEILVGPG